jgi:hypothetical protein
LSKVPAYDRGFRERARDKVHVLVVFKSGNAESERKAQLMRSAVAEQQDIAGLPHDVLTSSYSGAGGLTAEVKRRSVSILYVSTGLSQEVEPITAAMQPLGVITVTAVPDYVRRGLILGFELEAGKPHMSIHLESAKKSGIRFTSALLRLAKVYR